METGNIFRGFPIHLMTRRGETANYPLKCVTYNIIYRDVIIFTSAYDESGRRRAYVTHFHKHFFYREVILTPPYWLCKNIRIKFVLIPI